MGSNIINLVQYLATIIFNKNVKNLKNNAIKTDIILVLITILIPILILKYKIEVDLFIVPLFIILYILFLFLNNNVHKLYLEENNIIEKVNKNETKEFKKIFKYIFILACTAVLLFIVGELLGNTLENLSKLFGVPESLIGILLGFITSIPELITFFESQRHNTKMKDEMHGVVEATNNLLTSNTLNLFVIQTIGIFIK